MHQKSGHAEESRKEEEAQRKGDEATFALVLSDQKSVLNQKEVSEEKYCVIGIIRK